MVITLLGNMNHTYHQALRVAYDKGKAEGTLDEQTIIECEAVFSRERYHAENKNITAGDANDGTCYHLSGLQQGYEEAMERARQHQRHTNSQHAQGTNEVSESAISDLARPPSLTEDNRSNVKSLFAPVGLGIQHQQRVARMFSMIQNLNPLTFERAEAVADSESKNKDWLANDVVLDASVIEQRQIDRQS